MGTARCRWRRFRCTVLRCGRAVGRGGKVRQMVPVPLRIVAKLALYWAIGETGVSQSELARRLNVRETIVRRMLDPNHGTRQEKIQAALAALGKRMVMAYDDAA
jgi:antitoxin HicB